MAYKYREVFEKALDVVNYPSPEHSLIANIWDFMNVQPQQAYASYFRTPPNISFKKKTKIPPTTNNHQIPHTYLLHKILPQRGGRGDYLILCILLSYCHFSSR